jgi:F-type H+-transporting ATPase subunit gamma
MANTKAIKQKIKAITSIKKITKTMEMVSFAKMKKANDEVHKIVPYINEVKNLVEMLVVQNAGEKHELFSPTSPNLSLNKGEEQNREQSEVVIIFASNKGLCGSYNSNVYKKARKYWEENLGIKKAICLGKFAERIAKRLNLEIVESYLEIDKMTSLDFLKLEKNFRANFTNGEYKKVHVVYTNFIKNGVYEAVANCVYPLSGDISKYTNTTSPNLSLDKERNENISENVRENSQYIYEPGINNILSSLVPKLVSTVLYSYLLEARASEHSMRSFAMKRANESAGEMLHTLKLKYNRVRQDGITQEIAEISAGANAS